MKLVKQLPVKLTDEEVDIKTKEMVELMSKYDNVEAEKKETTKKYVDEMKQLRIEYTDLRRIVTDRKERRDVECFREANLQGKVWEIRRSDTGEIVEMLAMSQFELDEQRQLDIETYAGASTGAGA